VTRLIATLAEVAAGYDAAFVDLWGCVHNGLAAWPEAVAACLAFRAGGRRVVFVTNAPRPRATVEGQLARLGIPAAAYDAVATSGDAARVALFEGAVGRRLWFMGLAGDREFLTPPRLLADPVAIEETGPDEAEGIVCCGPPDPFADPAVHAPVFARLVARGVPLLCANPDIVVDRGERREWCAGALAQLYERLGGRALYFGKPHPPIYDLARRRLAALGGCPPKARILAIGDGPQTDIRGAMGEGLDSLLLTGGLMAAETATPPGGGPDPARLGPALAHEGVAPTYAMGFLR
jgi:HAD superfamily hydrolase (TIGR01450 family)